MIVNHIYLAESSFERFENDFFSVFTGVDRQTYSGVLEETVRVKMFDLDDSDFYVGTVENGEIESERNYAFSFRFFESDFNENSCEKEMKYIGFVEN